MSEINLVPYYVFSMMGVHYLEFLLTIVVDLLFSFHCVFWAQKKMMFLFEHKSNIPILLCISRWCCSSTSGRTCLNTC